MEESLETVTEKIKILKLALTNNNYLHYIVFLPNDIETIEEYLNTEKLSLDIYDYYTYYGLDYNTHLKLLNKTKIGRIFLKGTSLSTDFNEPFIKKIKYYLSIEKIINKLDTKLPPRNEVDKITWSGKVKLLHKDLLEKNKWECVICDDTEYLSDITICPKCNIGTPDMYETIKSQKSLLKVESKTEPVKPTVKIGRFGKRK